MTYKILDTCCFISFFKDITSCDMKSICEKYHIPITEEVSLELSKPESAHIINLFGSKIFNRMNGHPLYREIRNTLQGIGIGEASAFALAAQLNETTNEKIIFVTDDRIALTKLSKFRVQPDVVSRFPKIQNMLMARPIDVIEYLFSKGNINNNMLRNIINDLEPFKIHGVSRLEKHLKNP